MRVFIGLKIFAATPRRRALRSGVELFVDAYSKVGKARRSGVGFFVAAYQKVRLQKFMFAMQRHRVLRCCGLESME